MGYMYEADKFGVGGFTCQKSDLLGAPRIAECPLRFEAQHLVCHQSANEDGDEASDHVIVEMKLRRVHAHRNMIVPGPNHIDTERWNPLCHFSSLLRNALDLGTNFRVVN